MSEVPELLKRKWFAHLTSNASELVRFQSLFLSGNPVCVREGHVCLTGSRIDGATADEVLVKAAELLQELMGLLRTLEGAACHIELGPVFKQDPDGSLHTYIAI